MFEMTKLNKTVLKTSKIVSPFLIFTSDHDMNPNPPEKMKIKQKDEFINTHYDDAEDAISVMFDKHNY